MGLKLAKCRLVRRTALLGFIISRLVNIDYVWIILLYSEGNTTKLAIRGTSVNGAKRGVLGWGGGGGRARKKF